MRLESSEDMRGQRSGPGRGRRAWRPHRIPLAGWRDILLRVRARILRDRVPLIAAGVAFFGLLALFPGIATLLALAGLVFDADLVLRQVDALRGVAPDAPLAVVSDQARALAEQACGRAGATVAISLAISLFWASRGMDNLVEGLNVAYAEAETRNIVTRNLVSIALTALFAALALAALALSLAVPWLAAQIGLEGRTDAIVTWGRWPLLALVTLAFLAIVYRHAPARRPARWAWVTPGAALAACLWLGGSLAFTFFVRNFGAYNPTYGALAGVVILLLWMWLTSFVILLGAQLDAEMEHQTRRDTTRGRERPMGRRGAHMADTLGRRP
jgi:membrane protein